MATSVTQTPASDLFTRVATILDTARERVVRSVNHETITAYWLIGREIVEALQSGDAKAAYGRGLLAELATQLIQQYGAEFHRTNLEYFRRFYLAYPAPTGSIPRPVGQKSLLINQSTKGKQLLTSISDPLGQKLQTPLFYPNLSWSHYRALLRVEDQNARTYYERETAACNWSKRDLERQIATQYYERIMSSKDKQNLIESTAKTIKALRPIDVLKDPMILEFLNLPDSAALHESDLETAIVSDIQRFLLELGRGFSFVARQERLRFDDQDFYIDLVFYNYLLRCFVLVDLKIGELTHQDLRTD